MKILLNGLPISHPISGVGQYVVQLGSALEALLGAGNVHWFGKSVSRYRRDSFDTVTWLSLDRTRMRVKTMLRVIPGLKRLVRVWRATHFRLYARRIRPSVYHETNYVPFSFEHGPTITTIYDLSFLRSPQWHPKDRAQFFGKYCLSQIKNLDGVIAISEFTRKEILSLLPVDPDKVRVTHLGVNPGFAPAGERMRGLPERYILFLGNLEPRKNLPRLLEAYASLPEMLRERFPLVISGAEVWHINDFRQALHALRNGAKIILTGYVPQASLPSLYRGASLFVYPSLYEGFGLPVVEAMASGVPVLTSNTTSLPEVVGDAGVLVDPLDVRSLRDAMVELLGSESARRELSVKGLERAKLFTWDKCARETMAVYERVLGERAGTTRQGHR